MSVSNVIKGVYSARTHVRVCAVFGREYGVESHTVHLPHDLMSGWAFAFGLLSTLDRCIAKKKGRFSAKRDISSRGVGEEATLGGREGAHA